MNLDELERRLVVCYTGKPRQSAINNWGVFKAHIDNKRAVVSNLERISQIAQKLRDALVAGNWAETGKLMHAEWQFRRRNLPTISTKVIDRIIDTHEAQRRTGGQGVRGGRRRLRRAVD